MNQLQINYKSVTSLTPSVNNTRLHSDEQIREIANSIKEFGFTSPILIDAKNNIIAGEGRYHAAKLAKVRKVPTIVLEHLTPIQRRAYMIADNKIALNSTWDMEKLNQEVSEIMKWNIDLDTLGFDNSELEEILKRSLDENLTAVVGHVRKQSQNEPGDITEKKNTQLGVLVICKDIDEQEEIFEQLTQQGFKCKNTVT